MQGRYMAIDVSDAEALFEALRQQLSERQGRLMLTRALRRTSQHVKTIVKKEVSEDYVIPQYQVAKHIGRMVFGGNGADISCAIPIRGHRLSIGGKGKNYSFPAQGGAKGWASLNYIGKKRYKVKANIVRGKQSVLPTEMNKISDSNAPFRNTSAPKLNNVTFVRKGQHRFPIQKVVGIAVPQMPMNRSRDDVQEEISAFLMKRMMAEYQYIISKVR